MQTGCTACCSLVAPDRGVPGGTGRKVPAFSLLEHGACTLQLLLNALHLGQALHLLLELCSLLRNGLELSGVACYVRVCHLSLHPPGLRRAAAAALCQAEHRGCSTYCEPSVGICGLLERLDHKLILQTASRDIQHQGTKWIAPQAEPGTPLTTALHTRCPRPSRGLQP